MLKSLNPTPHKEWDSDFYQPSTIPFPTLGEFFLNISLLILQ